MRRLQYLLAITIGLASAVEPVLACDPPRLLEQRAGRNTMSDLWTPAQVSQEACSGVRSKRAVCDEGPHGDNGNGGMEPGGLNVERVR